MHEDHTHASPVLTAPSVLRRLLDDHGIRLTKALGQHFLADGNILARIIEACDLSHGEPVVEVGAGLGTLTLALASRADPLWAVEKDPRLVPLLKDHVARWPNVRVLASDFRRVRLKDLGTELTVVGNLPYGITSDVLLTLIRERNVVKRGVLMVQRELGERLLSPPGPKISRLGVHLNAYFRLSLVRRIAATAFFPPPEVESVLITADRLPIPRIQAPPDAFETVLAALFATRRKTARNSLAALVCRERVAQILEQLGLPPSVRGEALSVEQVDALAKTLLKSDS